MRAYILSIGSELTQGRLTDTNATFLAQELIGLGIDLLHVVQVPDDRGRLERTIRLALDDADLVVCSGGVGPTEDDLTREAIAAVAGETPDVDPALLATIRSFFAARGLEMPEQNAKQAWLIPAAESLPNPVGTAPGWFVRIDGKILVSMPGVPREMYRMWREQVAPRLAPLLPERAYQTFNFKTLGIGESAVGQRIGDLMRQPQPYVGTYAKDDGVHVSVTGRGATPAEAAAALAPVVADIRQRLAPWIYTESDRSLAGALLDLLLGNDLTLAVAGAGTGGRFGSLLYTEPEAGTIVRGLTVVGLETAPDVEAAAQRVMHAFGADVGMGIGAEARPVDQGLFEGTVQIALVGALDAREAFPLRAAFPEFQRRAALNAADVLRRAILGIPSSF
ncbi:MAG TPA: molybdopterin-binding protein [Thermomicrobiales bacterium]|nr:molybdopterin-binding protein [Thermomicrobiales bacterium]